MVDAVDKLSIEDQEALKRVTKRRVIEHRRNQLAHEVHQAQLELEAEGCSAASSNEILNGDPGRCR